MATAIQALPGGGPYRLAGALAAATVVAATTSAKERLRISGAGTITIRAKLSAVTLTPELQVHPMLADATEDDTVGTRAVTSVPSALAFSDTTEQETDFTSQGEGFIEIEVASAAGESATIDYIDVYVKPA